MAQENRGNRKFEIELNVRIKFDENRPKIVTVGKWIAVFIVPVLVKIASHYLVLWLHLA